MRYTRLVIALSILAMTFAACKDRSGTTPQNEAVQELKPPLLYLNGSSGKEEVTIRVQGKTVWNKVVPMGSLMPNIHVIKIEREPGAVCEISIRSESLNEKKTFKWVDGEYFSVNFNNYKNGMIQQMKTEPRYL